MLQCNPPKFGTKLPVFALYWLVHVVILNRSSHTSSTCISVSNYLFANAHQLLIGRCQIGFGDQRSIIVHVRSWYYILNAINLLSLRSDYSIVQIPSLPGRVTAIHQYSGNFAIQALMRTRKPRGVGAWVYHYLIKLGVRKQPNSQTPFVCLWQCGWRHFEWINLISSTQMDRRIMRPQGNSCQKQWLLEMLQYWFFFKAGIHWNFLFK